MTAAPETLSLEELGIPDNPQLMPVVGDAAPKRRRGRPRKDGLPPGSASGTSSETTTSGQRGVRRGSKAWVSGQCSSLVALGNLGLLFVSKPDALNEQEMTLLSDALTAEAMSSDRIMRWLTTAGKITPHIMMIQAAATIAVPRLQRRGILPPPRPLSPEELSHLTQEQQAAYNEYYRQFVATAPAEAASSGATDSPGSAVPMEAGPAFEPDRGYWQR